MEHAVHESTHETTGTSVPEPVPEAVRMQILATEHWGLLATRGMIWNEIFTRATMFFTLVSVSVVALALVAQASEFGDDFRLFALLLLHVVLGAGFFTVMRMGDALRVDTMSIIGMNRLRHAYLDIAQDLEPYFVMSRYDDDRGLLWTAGVPGFHAGQVVTSTSFLVGIVDAMVAAVLVGLIVESLGASPPLYVLAGIMGAASVLIGLRYSRNQVERMRRDHVPRFPHPS
jgi:hypothetical protein